MCLAASESTGTLHQPSGAPPGVSSVAQTVRINCANLEWLIAEAHKKVTTRLPVHNRPSYLPPTVADRDCDYSGKFFA